MTTLTFIAELGHASKCEGYGAHRPEPRRYVWHHILPQVCGGKTVSSNLVQLCDNCHYAVHSLMYNGRDSLVISGGTRAQRSIANLGLMRAYNAGTEDKIPNEGGHDS